MSDNSQPVSSRRALREKRRAEMEALLASSKAEQEAKELADKQSADPEEPTKAAAPGATPKSQPAPKPEPAKPAAAKPAAKPSASPKKPAAPTAPKAVKPAPQKPEAGKAAPQPAAPKPAAAQAAKPEAKPQAAAKPAKEQPKAKPEAAKPAAAPDDALGERASLRRARDREALRERRRLEEEVGALTTNIPTVDPANEPKPLTRRQLRLQALAEQGKASPAPQPAAKKPSTQDNGPETTVMSVEQALAARRAHAPKTSVDPNLLGEDDSEIDLEVLAHQREMAARAAIISRRAAERERLRVQNAQAGKDEKAPDPFTGAMGNIREVEDRIAKTGVQGPKTQSVSLALDSEGKVSSKKDEAAPAAKKPMAKPAPKPAVKPVAKSPAKPAPKPAARPVANAPAKPAPKPAAKPVANAPAKPVPAEKTEAPEPAANVEMPRIEAVNAQGLEPLDVQTHGVRRANNMLIAMIVALSVGGAALIAGLIMLFGN